MTAIYKTDPEARHQIDLRLKKIAAIEANLGLDSTKRERTNAKYKQNKFLLEIKEIDVEFYDTIEPDRRETEADKILKQK